MCGTYSIFNDLFIAVVMQWVKCWKIGIMIGEISMLVNTNFLAFRLFILLSEKSNINWPLAEAYALGR